MLRRYVNNNLGEDPEAPPSVRENMSPPLANTDAKPSNTTLVASPPRRAAVLVRGAYKQYGKRSAPVLQNLNMTVPEGTM